MLPKKYINKLQLVQNSLCRIVLRLGPRSHVSQKRRQLHWLPIEQRILLKLNLLTYKALHYGLPVYLKSMLTSNSYVSESKRLYIPPSASSNSLGKRSFKVAGPTEWNRLPLSVRKAPSVSTFRRGLKTHLFKKAYPQPP